MISNTTLLSHVRSSSFPSTSNNKDLNLVIVVNEVLNKHSTLLLLDECSSPSSSTSSTCKILCDDLKRLYEGIENSIHFPFNQQALSLAQHRVVVERFLEGSLCLLDMCSFINDVLSMVKESILELESCLRRKNGCKENIQDYLTSRKKVQKLISKYLKNMHVMRFEEKDDDNCTNNVGRMLKEAETLSLSSLKFVLGYFCRSSSKGKRSIWSLMSKLRHSKHLEHQKQEDGNELEKIDQVIYGLESKKIVKIQVKMAQDYLSKQLASQELIIFEFEECLGAISRCLLKTRVSLLNILSSSH